jgi:CubicO group peptidase (beta-lactamase class C family)
MTIFRSEERVRNRRGGVVGSTALILAAATLCFTSQAGAIEKADSLDALFSKWNKPDVPGCAVGVEAHGAAVVNRTYGSADIEHGVPIGIDTVFEAGSVSKQFTAAAVFVLVEQGKLSLADDIRKYVPELPDYGAVITVAQLLGHMSGLRDWEGVAEIAGRPVTTHVYSNKDVLAIAARQKNLNHLPGEEFSYTNTGYVLLAIIVERASGEPFVQFTDEHLFSPLKLTHTQWRDNFRRIVKERAVAYEASAGGYRQLMPFDNVFGSGGLLTTIGDLKTWNDALDAGALGKFVTEELQRESTLSDGRAVPYAGGLELTRHRGVRRIAHTGETAGYESYLARFPDQHLSVAVLCNAGSEVNIDSLGDQVADLFLPTFAEAPVTDSEVAKIKLTADQLAAYSGQYFDPHVVVRMQLEVKDGVLRRATDGLVLKPIGPAEFRTSNSTIRFTGSDRLVRDFDDGRRWTFRRIQPWHPDAAALSTFVGKYRSDEAQATYDVNAVNGRLVVSLDDRRWNAVELDAVAADTFTQSHHAYHFVRDREGRVSSLEISNGWEHVYALPFARVAAMPESPPR